MKILAHLSLSERKFHSHFWNGRDNPQLSHHPHPPTDDYSHSMSSERERWRTQFTVGDVSGLVIACSELNCPLIVDKLANRFSSNSNNNKRDSRTCGRRCWFDALLWCQWIIVIYDANFATFLSLFLSLSGDFCPWVAILKYFNCRFELFFGRVILKLQKSTKIWIFLP